MDMLRNGLELVEEREATLIFEVHMLVEDSSNPLNATSKNLEHRQTGLRLTNPYCIDRETA